MRKIFSMNIEEQSIKNLDNFIKPPCSRSDILELLIQYALENQSMLDYFVQKKLDEIKSIVNSV